MPVRGLQALGGTRENVAATPGANAATGANGAFGEVAVEVKSELTDGEPASLLGGLLPVARSLPEVCLLSKDLTIQCMSVFAVCVACTRTHPGRYSCTLICGCVRFRVEKGANEQHSTQPPATNPRRRLQLRDPLASVGFVLSTQAVCQNNPKTRCDCSFVCAYVAVSFRPGPDFLPGLESRRNPSQKIKCDRRFLRQCSAT